MEAIKAVFRSWDNPRANVYRRDNDIPYSWGTAVNVQMMAFGNMGETSGTGVAFTRDPATGEKHLMGEFLMNAQGEDVVAGVRTHLPVLNGHDVYGLKIHPDLHRKYPALLILPPSVPDSFHPETRHRSSGFFPLFFQE